MDEKTRTELEAAAFRRLVDHLRERTDVQNIDLMNLAGLRLPLESHVLQAFVSEGLKPIVPGVIAFGAGHFYISQSDKGGLVFGGDIDGWNTYAQRGNLPTFNHVVAGGVTMMARHGKVVHLKAVGTADREAEKPMQTDAIFRIASMTKALTSTAVLKGSLIAGGGGNGGIVSTCPLPSSS